MHINAQNARCRHIINSKGLVPVNHADVDIVIPVYNALNDVKRCIESILISSDTCKIQILIVNDASDKKTSAYLRLIAKVEDCIRLYENKRNQGYAYTANIGMRASKARYVVLLNSDTVVSKNWLNKLIRCADTDQRIGIVSPVTNSAIWQSVPYIPSPTVSTNQPPTDTEINRFADLVSLGSYSIYPRLPYIHGFCQFIKRELVDEIGFIDEVNFPDGLGSEQDYCYRAADAGYFSVIADDTFIYHSKAKSLAKSSRNTLWENNLNNKYGEQRHKINRPQVLGCPEMKALRRATTFEVYRSQLNHSIHSYHYNICILLDFDDQATLLDALRPIIEVHKTTDGFTSIVHMNSNTTDALNAVSKSHPCYSNKCVYMQKHEELVAYLSYFDAVVCSGLDTLGDLSLIQNNYPDLLVCCFMRVEPSGEEMSLLEEKTKPGFLESVLFISQSDRVARRIISTLGTHCFNLKRLYCQKQVAGLLPKVNNIVQKYKVGLLIKQRRKKLALFFKDAIIFHRKDQKLSFFSKGRPPTVSRQPLIKY